MRGTITSFIISGILLAFGLPVAAQSGLWHDTARALHYKPDGQDFRKVSGHKRFNRALYGGNTAFRVEAGDLPEFALYLPGMGGNFRLALLKDGQAKWLTDAADIQTVYRPGAMIYTIRDPMLGKGTIQMNVMALYDREGMILKVDVEDIPAGTILMAVYGGAGGRKFSRNGDIGADPESSFYLLPEYCKGNQYEYRQNTFRLRSAVTTGEKTSSIAIDGVFPTDMKLRLSSALYNTPAALDTALTSTEYPVLTARLLLPAKGMFHFLLQVSDSTGRSATNLPALFQAAEAARKQIAERVRIQTPDSFINTLGGALAIAGDAIWEDPSYLHGAVAWRMRLNAWRGAYIADPLGWHDRARQHFNSYALSQVTQPETGPVVPDTALGLARQREQMGTSLFSSGYISRNPGGDQRPHHYDMNLVFIDQLLQHFNWSGDTDYVRRLWPLLQRHLAWEQRNFDTDGDGLYDAYACIWASDALQYSGGGVMHSTAYNYRANKAAATLAAILKEDGRAYEAAADKIYKAIHAHLWNDALGRYAEYKDQLGNQLLHLQPAAWTVYHTLDARLTDPFKAWQMLHYAATELPRIPVIASGLDQPGLYLTATTNWQPYTWSVNNVALAENLHLSLAYWQGGHTEEAFRLWKSAIVESMHLSSSPGGFEQLSFYDAIRGELYRDFADPIGMAGRSLVEGLFGILPDALHDSLLIRPGFPQEWDHATIQVPDMALDYRATDTGCLYSIKPSFRKPLYLKLEVPVPAAVIGAVTVNGKPVQWQVLAGMGKPLLQVQAGQQKTYEVRIHWRAAPLEPLSFQPVVARNDTFVITTAKALITGLKDPQGVLGNTTVHKNKLSGVVKGLTGNRTLFVKLQQEQMAWWQPVALEVQPSLTYKADSVKEGQLLLRVSNHSIRPQAGQLIINPGRNQRIMPLSLPAGNTTNITINQDALFLGRNRLRFVDHTGAASEDHFYSYVPLKSRTAASPVDLTGLLNDKVTRIFEPRYLSPRPAGPTLQLPVQGIGNWCYPLVSPVITDTGFRRRAGWGNQLQVLGIPFNTPADTARNNVLFVSRWDLFRPQATIPLTGRGQHLYLLMTGTTNPMQSQLINGLVEVSYTDGSKETLELKNPETWWPIEQDYYEDGYAFHLKQLVPPRIHLKDGSVHRRIDHTQQYTSLKGFSNRIIEGGAATLLDIPLNNHKQLRSMTVSAIANDVIIGLMSATIIR